MWHFSGFGDYRKSWGSYLSPPFACCSCCEAFFILLLANYISQAQWTQLWRSCCDISYDPIVNIKRIKETSQDFKEISKYAVKGSDFLVGSPELMQRHVSNFLAGLSGRRLVGSTGVFKRVQRELCLDDPETGDLVITDGQQLAR